MKTAAVLVLLGLGLSPAAACGWEGERCCSTKKGGDACKVDGLECINGRCRVAPEECGGNGEACCAEEACDLHSLVCLSGSCTPCGKEGEPVCNEDGVSPCNSGLEPSDGICALICGDEGWPCCAPDDSCKVDGLTCIGGTCEKPPPCGKEGEPICPEAPICEGDLVDVDGICSTPPPCGGASEECCPGDKCDLHSLGCVGGTCVPCGKEGEPACTEDGVSPCNTGLEESEGICVVPAPPCGKEGEPICPEAPICEGDLIDTDGICTVPPPPCGKEGEPICPEAPICEGDLIDIDGICSTPPPCGGNGEECCPGDKCDLHSLGCVGGTCVPCGKEGQPECTEDGVSPCNSGLEGVDGICAVPDCGDKGETCCAGDACNKDTLFCSAGTCLPCGTSGVQACKGDGATPCQGDLVEIGGICQSEPEECGAQGEPCCGGTDCDDDGIGCINGLCISCGTNNKPACPGDKPCEEGLEVSQAGFCGGGKKETDFQYKW